MTYLPTIIIVGGPAGTGKTTAAANLAKHYNCPYIEGDSLHPQANIDKMSKGIPLNDDDRWDWLIKLTQVTVKECQASQNNMAIVTCSILKKAYRQLIETTGKPIDFKFVFLFATFDELVNRVENRKNHYMKSDMVKSQYDIMEVPAGDELIVNGGNCLTIDTTQKSMDNIYKEIVDNLNLS